MTNLATTLLDFILDLLRDEEAAAAFQADPEAALEAAGLGDLCSADVDAVLPALIDFAPSGVLSYTRPDTDGEDGVAAVEHVKYIQENLVEQEITTTVHNDFSNSVWGDSIKIWAEDDAEVNVAKAGDGGVALADSDVEGDLTVENDHAFNTAGDNSAIGEEAVAGGAGNDAIGEDAVAVGDVSGGTTALGEDSEVEIDASVEDSHNGHNEMGDGVQAVGNQDDVDVEDTEANDAGDTTIAPVFDFEEADIAVGEFASAGNDVDGIVNQDTTGTLAEQGPGDLEVENEGLSGNIVEDPTLVVIPLGDPVEVA
jgi:hypothetical protein